MLRVVVVAAVLTGGVLLGACGAGVQPTAQDLTACGTVNNLLAGVFAADLLSQQEVVAAQLLGQATASGNASLISGAEQLQAAARAQSSAQAKTALTHLGAACSAMGVGPSSGGL